MSQWFIRDLAPSCCVIALFLLTVNAHSIFHRIWTWFCCAWLVGGCIINCWWFIWFIYLYSSGLLHVSQDTVYPKKYAHGFVVLCFVVVMQSFIMNSHEVFIHIHQGCFAGTGAIVRLPQCQWSKPDGYGKISQCITTTKHSKAKTMCIYLGIYCISHGIWYDNDYSARDNAIQSAEYAYFCLWCSNEY